MGVGSGAEIKRYILRCSCGGVKSKMDAALQLMFPDTSLAVISSSLEEVKGMQSLVALAESSPYAHTPFSDLLLTLAKKRGRYCYYVEVNRGGEVILAKDLMTGRNLV